MKLISKKGTFEVNDFEVNRTMDLVFSADTLVMKARNEKDKDGNPKENKYSPYDVDSDVIQIQDVVPIATIVRIPVELENAPEGKEMFLDILKIGNSYSPIGYGYTDEEREGELVYIKNLSHMNLTFDENGNPTGDKIPISVGNIDISELISKVELNYINGVLEEDKLREILQQLEEGEWYKVKDYFYVESIEDARTILKFMLNPNDENVKFTFFCKKYLN